MTEQNKVAGIVLAGGMARRMDNQDKGLIEFAGRPLVDYARDRLQSVANQIGISANRNLDQYQNWGFAVIKDTSDTFAGPLAGVYAALEYFDADVLVVMPCDSPLFSEEHLQRLIDGLSDQIDIVIASDGQNVHPVFMVLKTQLKASLENYLSNQGRRVQDWVMQQSWGVVEFNDAINIFANINTVEELRELESRVSKDRPGLSF